MSYHIRKVINDWAIIGRPGFAGKRKLERREELQEKFGTANWQIVHLVEGKLLSREKALQYYEEGYFHFFEKNPEILEWLIATAEDIYDTAPSNIKSGLDYTIQETASIHLQDIAIRRVLKRLNKKFEGGRLLQIRGTDNEGSILNPGLVPFHQPELIFQPQLKGWWHKNTIESFWQSNKVLAVKLKRLQELSKFMVGIILRKEVKMGKGKFCTQAAHAATSLLPEQGKHWDFSERPAEIWSAKGEANLIGLYSKARKMNLNASIIRDAGKTQIAAGTLTAIGLGPVNEAVFDALMSACEAEPNFTLGRSYRNFKSMTLQ